MDWTVINAAELRRFDWGLAALWIHRTLGEPGETWAYVTSGKFTFANPADATAFLLRWA